MNFEYRNDGTLIRRGNAHPHNGAPQAQHGAAMIRPQVPQRPNGIHEKPGFYWTATLFMAAVFGLLFVFSLYPFVIESFGLPVTEIEFLVISCFTFAGFIAGAIIYNRKCHQNRTGIYKGRNYLLSGMASLGIGAASIPVALIVLAIIAAVLGILITIALIYALCSAG